jgi:hypothetical protein
MVSYYGQGPDGQMGHIRLKETMEEWHARCKENAEWLRRLREDVGTEYSRKDAHRNIQALKAWREAADARFAEINDEVGALATALAYLIDLVAPEVTADLLRGDELPEPEGGWAPSFSEDYGGI